MNPDHKLMQTLVYTRYGPPDVLQIKAASDPIPGNRICRRD